MILLRGKVRSDLCGTFHRCENLSSELGLAVINDKLIELFDEFDVSLLEVSGQC